MTDPESSSAPATGAPDAEASPAAAAPAPVVKEWRPSAPITDAEWKKRVRDQDIDVIRVTRAKLEGLRKAVGVTTRNVARASYTYECHQWEDTSLPVRLSTHPRYDDMGECVTSEFWLKGIEDDDGNGDPKVDNVSLVEEHLFGAKMLPYIVEFLKHRMEWVVENVDCENELQIHYTLDADKLK